MNITRWTFGPYGGQYMEKNPDGEWVRAADVAAALEAAREDAERYRWLRDEARTNRAPHIFQYPAQSFDHPQYPHFKDVGLDAAIDSARGIA